VKVELRVQENGESEGLKSTTDRVINVLSSPPMGIPMGLFIGVVRGSGNNVLTTP
jgi:hypothetical protein